MNKRTAFLLVIIAIGLTSLSQAPGLLAAGSPHSVPATAARVRGVWKVTKVSIDPSATVSALLDNDPSYFGATVTFAGNAITWNTDHTNGKGTYDSCNKPNYSISPHTSGLYVVKCSNNASGIDATVKMVNYNTLILNWYDGGILTLTRVSSGS